MGEMLKKIIGQVKEVLGKLETSKKIIVGAVAGVVVVAFIVMFNISSGQSNVLLFSELSAADFGQVTKKLEELGYQYDTTGTTAIFVSPQQRDIIMTKLAQEQMIPKGIPGWKLFDVSKWTETEKEIGIKKMRALRGEVKRHIESLKNIDRASVEIAVAEDTIYDTKQADYTAAVTVHLAPGYESLSKKEVRGIVFLVHRAVGNRLKPENVTVTNEYGVIISDFDNQLDEQKERFKLIEIRKKFEEKYRIKWMKEIREGLAAVFTEDRVQIIRLNLNFNWDKIKEEINEVGPVVMEKDNPATPYSERKVKDSLKISEKNVKEKFKGHGFNPEGVAGVDSNKPAGYKAADDQFAEYEKNETITNHEYNKIKRLIEREPYKVFRKSVSIVIDGIQHLPMKSDGSYDLDPLKAPVQKPVPSDVLAKAEDLVKKAINFNLANGDQVSVKNIMFDRSKYWESIREKFRRQEQMKRMLVAILVGVVALFLGYLLFKAISKELERRRRSKEEALALEQQRMREAALRAAEEEGIDVELSLEEKARLELQESAINLAKERPDDVAALLRTWLAEE